MKRKQYEKELRKLQTELCRLQEWVKLKGLRVIVVFEGRDAAGKGGTIKAITERVSPRVFRLVALPAPSDREKTQMYLQRYMQHFPAAGEVVIFDRSWYNRAGVERVMGFCSDEEYRRFLENCPVVEKYIVDGGIILIKFWLEVGKKEQAAAVRGPHRRPDAPMEAQSDGRPVVDPLVRLLPRPRHDAGSHRHRARAWYIVRSDDKKRARLNCIAHLLSLIPYEEVPRKKVKLPKRSNKDKYDDQATLEGRRFVPEKY